MLRVFENLFAVAALIGTEAWFLKGYFAGEPDFEPGLAFLTATGVILTKELIREKFSPAQEAPASNHDKELFRLFLDTLPPNQTSRFFKEHDFGGPFSKSEIAPLYLFVETWGSVDKEFLDDGIEDAKKAVYALASDLATEIARRVVPIQGGDLLSVYSDQERAKGQPRPESVIEDAKVLNKRSSIFRQRYEEFIRLCRSKLAK